MKKQNILILGSGGREHAFAWKISQSPLLNKLFIAPGNAGTMQHGENICIDIKDFNAIGNCCTDNKIDILLVGPEEPLVLGIHDYFLANNHLKHVAVIGPQKNGAMLEGSKDFAKEFMRKYDIPTAQSITITKENLNEGYRFLEALRPPYVLKADGLAAGKGVIILSNLDEAKSVLNKMISELKYGKASEKVVIEKFLSGIELSVFIMTDGTSYKILPEAKDYKRIGEGDTGPNTGGMGAVSPVPFATPEFMQKVESQVIIPTINGLIKEGIKYKGFIFIGIMNMDGNPYVIEYNTRMGDPETEVVIPRIKSDFVELLAGLAQENLKTKNLEIEEKVACTVMLVSKGYPGDYEKAKIITGLDKKTKSIPFHAGTVTDKENNITTNGGRVIAVTSVANTMSEVLNKSFYLAKHIDFEGKYFRKDIGHEFI